MGEVTPVCTLDVVRGLLEPRVEVEERADGIVLRSPVPLTGVVPSAVHWLEMHAHASPDVVWLAERAGAGWRTLTWGEAARNARAIAGALKRLGLGPERPLLVLSGNSLTLGLLTVGCYCAGVPIVPVSPAYSLRSVDFGKIRVIVREVRPGLVFVEDPAGFAGVLGAVELGAEVVDGAAVWRWSEGETGEHVEVTPDTVAKILFTSGSTGLPKGVINTHRMICANQAQITACWPFLRDHRPVLLDWLPWNHTFGGNHDFHLVMAHGGTLYIDDGKPVPGLVERTTENLRMVSPTLYFNVPAGFRALLPFLEGDEALRDRFFARLELIFYAGAALSQDLWLRIERLAEAAGRPVLLTSAWGATETAPLATSVHWPIDEAGTIGLPAPGVELKLARVEARQELRVRGPNVTPGYLRPEQTAEAFDDEGFYKTGDAAFLADPDRPELGVVFDGRIAEDFKLSTGTWVAAGTVRLDVLAATDGLLTEVVVTGADRHELGLLAWRAEGADLSEVIERLRVYNERNPRSSRRIRRLLWLAEPPEIDAGEITDKGYVNPRAVLRRRREAVASLYAAQPPDDVVWL